MKMKQATVHLSIPQSCDQQWDDMSVSENGRHCSQCAKEVIDFSTFSDRQLLHYVTAHADQEICGQLKASQLEKALFIEQKATSGLSVAALVLLAITMTSSPAYSQVPAAQTENVALLQGKDTTALNDDSTMIVISGTIAGTTGDNLLPFPLVSVKHGDSVVCSFMADGNGHFLVKISKLKTFDALLIEDSNYKDTIIPLNSAYPETLVMQQPIVMERTLEPFYRGSLTVLTTIDLPSENRWYRRMRYLDSEAHRKIWHP